MPSFHPYGDSFEVVDVWVGRFGSPKRLTTYMQESDDDGGDDAGDGDDDGPLSEFAADQRQEFYDHDFLEAHFAGPQPNFADLAGELSGYEWWGAPASSAATAASAATATATAAATPAGPPRDTVLLAFGPVIEKPTSCKGRGYELTYLGRFSKDDAAG